MPTFSATRVLLLNCSAYSNEFADRPAGFAIEVTATLLTRIASLSAACKELDLTEVRFRVGFESYDSARMEECFDEELSDRLTDIEHLALEPGATLPSGDMEGIRGEQITVTADDWSVTCFCKYSGTTFESATIPLHAWLTKDGMVSPAPAPAPAASGAANPGLAA